MSGSKELLITNGFIKPTYKTAPDFRNGKAQVSNGKETFYIDKKGKRIK